MSAAHEPRSRQSEDRIPARRIALIGAAALLIFCLGIVWSTWLWRRSPRREDSPDAQRIPRQVGRQEIGAVFQQPFDLTESASGLRARDTRRLESYGWSDRPGGFVHIPIDRAMERLLDGERP